MAKTVSIIHILVSGKAAKDRLPEQPANAWRPFLPWWARTSLASADSPSTSSSAIGKQTGIGGHDRTAKLQHQAAVEIEPGARCLISSGKARRSAPASTHFSSCPTPDGSPAGFVMMGASMRNKCRIGTCCIYQAQDPESIAPTCPARRHARRLFSRSSKPSSSVTTRPRQCRKAPLHSITTARLKR